MCKLTNRVDAILAAVRRLPAVTARDLQEAMRALHAALLAAEMGHEAADRFAAEALERAVETPASDGAALEAVLRQALHAVPALRRAMGHAGCRVPQFAAAGCPRWDLKELSNRVTPRRAAGPMLRPVSDRRAPARGPLRPLRGFETRKDTHPMDAHATDARAAVDAAKVRRLLRSLGDGNDGVEPPDIGTPALIR